MKHVAHILGLASSAAIIWKPDNIYNQAVLVCWAAAIGMMVAYFFTSKPSGARRE